LTCRDAPAYRAAGWVSNDQQGEVVLTLPEHSHLPADVLISKAKAQAAKSGLDLWVGTIEIAMWRMGKQLHE
jgi:hypothetical protein